MNTVVLEVFNLLDDARTELCADELDTDYIDFLIGRAIFKLATHFDPLD